MSIFLAQRLTADSVAVVAEGHDLQGVLTEIRVARPQLMAQENSALQDVTYGC